MSPNLNKLKVRCPRCRAWVSWANTPTRPFCSERCKGGDLGDWATEKYRIPSEEHLEGEEKPQSEE